MSTATQENEVLQLIGGGWEGGVDSSANVDPSDGGEFGRVARGTADDVDRAVEAAAGKARDWAATPAGERAAILNRAAAALVADVDAWALTMATEMGKPVSEARVECLRAAAILRYFAEELHRPVGEHYLSDVGDTWLFTRREAVGVVGLITPWNFPAAIPAWKLAPALTFGNAVVLKPAGDAPATGMRLVRALVEAGLPDGVLNVVLGPGGELGRRMVEHPGIDAISFTGSEAVGRGVIAGGASTGKRVQAEMGGHNPAIVCADANLDGAVAALVAGGFSAAGQKCTATRRVFVERQRYEEVVERLGAAAAALRVGDAKDPGTVLGPLAGVGQRDEVEEAVRSAGTAGRVVAGAARPGGVPEAGAFLDATVIADLPLDSEFATTEVFGPALAVWPFDGEDEAIELANRTSYGLSAAIFTRDLDRAKRFVGEIEVGLVHVNSQTAGAEVHVPFGGDKGSSYGPHEQGRAAIEFYSKDKTVYFDAAG
jgi:aldehyde dehydrogenase (NAD+)